MAPRSSSESSYQEKRSRKSSEVSKRRRTITPRSPPSPRSPRSPRPLRSPDSSRYHERDYYESSSSENRRYRRESSLPQYYSSSNSSKQRHSDNNMSQMSKSLRRHRRTRSRSSSSSTSSPRSSRDNPMASRCIGVFGLNTNTTQIKIREIFSKFGPIDRIQMVIDAHTGRSRGFCFIYYDTLRDAKTAKDTCSGIEVDDRRIRVDYSITQRPHTPTPGIYMGRPSRSAQRAREAYRMGRCYSPSKYYRGSESSYRSSRSSRYYEESQSPPSTSSSSGRGRSSRY